MTAMLSLSSLVPLFALILFVAATPASSSAAPKLCERDPVPAGYVAAPYYPTPKGGWVASWADSYAKVQAVVSNMTLAEKVNLTTGTGYFMVSAQHIIGAS